MLKNKKNRFLASHAKSSAALISLGIHAVLIVVAISFVAVTVIQKEDQHFVAKTVKRPKMKLNKLQAPIKFEKKRTPKPKLRKRLVVKPRLDQKIPEIKMPEISGMKGGLGGAVGDGVGSVGSLGFSMPEINLFGVKGRGEKIFIILESSGSMMIDEMGGIPAYTLIKQEVVKVLDGLPSTAVFNIVVYDTSRVASCFPEMVPVSGQNVQHVKEWLKPLNAVKSDVGSTEYGLKTLGEGGTQINEDFLAGILQRGRDWYPPAALGMKQQADTVFLLSNSWGAQWHPVESIDSSAWYQTSAGKRWMEAYEKGKILLEEENRNRVEAGQPPRVLSHSPWGINGAYFPNLKGPPQSKEKYWYTVSNFTDALLEVRKQFRPVERMKKLGIERKKSASKGDFSLNVIHFLPRDSDQKQDERFKNLANKCNGEYRTLTGLQAIESSIKGSIEELNKP